MIQQEAILRAQFNSLYGEETGQEMYSVITEHLRVWFQIFEEAETT